jgi:type I restriction enzyme S subunit
MCVSELAGKILNQYHLFVERRFLPLQNRVEKGVAYTGINIEDLRKLPVEFPSIEEQRQIIRRIETAFAWVDRLASEASKARKLFILLDQALLARAFRGELVPQDPSDEPATILLERLRNERGLSEA